jgi:hypothetical protein
MLEHLYGKKSLTRKLSSQTFPLINTPATSNLVTLHTYPPMNMEQSVPKRRHIKFRHRGITQKKAYNVQNTAKVWNQLYKVFMLFKIFLCNTNSFILIQVGLNSIFEVFEKRKYIRNDLLEIDAFLYFYRLTINILN